MKGDQVTGLIEVGPLVIVGALGPIPAPGGLQRRT